MSLNSLGMGLVFTAEDLASGAISQLERRFMSFEGAVTGGSDRIHTAFKGVGTGMSIFAAGAAGLAGAFALASAAGKFEEAIAAVGAVSNGTAADLKGLHDAALDAGIRTQYTPIEATNGLRALAQAGFNATESMKLLFPALDLAAGSLGELTPEAGAGLAAQAMKAFGISVEGAAFAVDQMLTTQSLFALRAGELPLALGHAADGANVLHQSLGETLIALGLIKNVIPGVERAATAASVAMERLADPKTQERLNSIGVHVADHGNFRQFMDILGDLAPKMAAVTQQARAAFLLKTFGHHAMTGVGAILNQITNGIRTQTGETLKGAEAVSYLRSRFDGAGGAAAKFRDTLLSTFEGQKKLLRGSVQTLFITLGEPFAEAFKPIVSAITDGLNVVLVILKEMPAPLKRMFAQVVLGASAFLTLVGGVLLAKAAIGVLSIAMTILGVSFTGVLWTLASAVAILGVLALVGAGLKVAWEKNLGGIADVVERAGRTISLFFQGVSQLIEEGGFSGAVRNELDKVENSGLKQFLVQCWMTYYRLERFWGGLKEGFTDTIAVVWPFFQELSESFDKFATEIGTLFGAVTGGASALPSERFRNFGRAVGEVFAWIVAGATWVLSQILVFAAGLIRGFREMFGFVTAAGEKLGVALGKLVDAWNNLTGAGDGAGASLRGTSILFEDVGVGLGRIFDVLLAGLIGVLTWLVDVIRRLLNGITKVRSAFREVADFVSDLGHAIVWFFAEAIPKALGWAGAAISKLLAKLGDGAASFFGMGSPHLTSSVEDGGPGPLTSSVSGLAAESVANAPMPAAAVASLDAENASTVQGALAAATAAVNASSLASTQPITVNVQVDGETIASANASANADLASRTYSSVPQY